MNPAVAAQPETKERYWLHCLLLVLTLITTTVVGAQLAYNFEQNRPSLMSDDLFGLSVITDPAALAAGLPFSLTLITILMAHEMGHYLCCAHYGIDASLPYFLPAPTLIGTLGAFIRIRGAIYSKKQLFDVAIAGPLAGFAFLIPALGIGLAYSKIVPGLSQQGDFSFGTPLLLRLAEAAIFPGVEPVDIALHPVARAAWVGMLATALNLMPIGQLDGGHLLYAFVGPAHRFLTHIFIALLIPLAVFFSWTWLVWALLLFFLARRHPRIYDESPIGSGRKQLGFLALVIFTLCFSAAPVSKNWLQ